MDDTPGTAQNPRSTTTGSIAEDDEIQLNGTLGEITGAIINLLPQMMRGHVGIVDNPLNIQALRDVITQIFADVNLRDRLVRILIEMDQELYSDHAELRQIVRRIIARLTMGEIPVTDQVMIDALQGVWMNSGSQLRRENRALRQSRVQREGAQRQSQPREVPARAGQEETDSPLRTVTSDSVLRTLITGTGVLARRADEQPQQIAHTGGNREAEPVASPSRARDTLGSRNRERELLEERTEMARRVAQRETRIAEQRRLEMELTELLGMGDGPEEPFGMFEYGRYAGLARARKGQNRVRTMLHRNRAIGRWIWGFDELGRF